MIRIGILGDIGSGKSYVAKQFGYPVFNADNVVSKLYKKDKKDRLQKNCFIDYHEKEYEPDQNRENQSEKAFN